MMFAWSAYIAIALFIAANTFIEGEENQGCWSTARVVGLLLSLVWPALLITVWIYVMIDHANLRKKEAKLTLENQHDAELRRGFCGGSSKWNRYEQDKETDFLKSSPRFEDGTGP